MSLREVIGRCHNKKLIKLGNEEFSKFKEYFANGFMIRSKTYGENDKIYEIEHSFMGILYIFYGIVPELIYIYLSIHLDKLVFEHPKILHVFRMLGFSIFK